MNSAYYKIDNSTNNTSTDFFEVLLENNPVKIISLIISIFITITGIPCFYSIIWFERLLCYKIFYY